MTKRLANEQIFDHEDQPLCCDFIEWDDGSTSCDLKKGSSLVNQNSNQTITYSASTIFLVDDVLHPKSELFGLDLDVSTVNSFLTLLGWSDVFQDFMVLTALIFKNGAPWTLFLSLCMLLMDLFSIYVTFFNAPLGVRSVYLEKIVLTAIHSLDVFYDFGVVTMFIFAGVWFGEDVWLVAVCAIALPVIAGNYLQLYYTTFDYEKDHEDDFEFNEWNVYL